MQTPLIILSILFLPTLLAAAFGLWTGRPGTYRTGGLWALSAAFVFFGVGHFIMTEDMVAMLPDALPARRAIVIATGLLEFALAALLLVPGLQRVVGLACVAVFVLFFPANIYAALQHSGPGGHQWGAVYLAVRAPIQLLLIAWAVWFAILPTRDSGQHQDPLSSAG
ncbi:MAG: hypothetical protein CML68_18285 [Rhodobacteraceae bacterium]|nr:hypothetical protein [Paracoccaceae bacterium]